MALQVELVGVVGVSVAVAAALLQNGLKERKIIKKPTFFIFGKWWVGHHLHENARR